MVDLQSEKLLSLPQAAKLLPPGRKGRPVHISTLLRPILRGELEALRVGSRWVTSAEALQRWCERQTAAFAALPASPTPAARRKAAERAGRELDSIGI